MPLNARHIVKFFSPRITAKALATLDKSTALVVSACWLAALVMLILAVFAVHGAVSAKKEAAEAITVEPVLPKQSAAPLNSREGQELSDRLQHQVPDIKIAYDQKGLITVRSDDGNKFHQWITAISYIDTMAPQYRWTLQDFCVGNCGSNGLMRASVAGQKIVFSLPQH